MNIDNSTNISSVVSQSLSKLNLNTLNRSYKAGEKEENNAKIENEEFLKNNVSKEETKETAKPSHNIDVAEIQKYANLMGENLTIEDINYGLMYGRSVIADFNA